MSANNSGLCFYTGYGNGPYENNDPGNPDLDNYAFAVNNDGRVTCQSILLGGEEISSWGDINSSGWDSPVDDNSSRAWRYHDPYLDMYFAVQVKNGIIQGFNEIAPP